MSHQWFYRIKGKEFGPVALDLVRSLVAIRAIAPDDEVRDSASSNWLLACAATELRGTNAAKPELIVERRVARDHWFYRGLAGELGPLNMIDLIKMAADGAIKPDEEIKATADDYWKQVHSFGRLTQLLPFNQSANSSLHQTLESARDDRSEILRFPPIKSSDANSEEAELPDDSMLATSADNREADPSEPTSSIEAPTLSNQSCPDTIAFPTMSRFASTGSANCRQMDLAQTSQNSSHELLWTGWMNGREFGPVDYAELLTCAVTGELAPTDFVRRGSEGQFIPAVNVPCLFTVTAATSSLSGQPLATSTPRSETTGFADAVLFNSNPAIVVSTMVDDEYEETTTSRASIIPLVTGTTQNESPAPRRASLFSEALTDPTSIGVSALLTIGLIVLGWIASL